MGRLFRSIWRGMERAGLVLNPMALDAARQAYNDAEMERARREYACGDWQRTKCCVGYDNGAGIECDDTCTCSECQEQRGDHILDGER